MATFDYCFDGKDLDEVLEELEKYCPNISWEKTEVTYDLASGFEIYVPDEQMYEAEKILEIYNSDGTFGLEEYNSINNFIKDTNENLNAFVSKVEKYCDLIEEADENLKSEDIPNRITELISICKHLYISIPFFPYNIADFEIGINNDYDSRFQLSRLLPVEESIYYKPENHRKSDTIIKGGNLNTLLHGIYYSLANGLDIFKNGHRIDACALWKRSIDKIDFAEALYFLELTYQRLAMKEL
jgi:hypothetical protein